MYSIWIKHPVFKRPQRQIGEDDERRQPAYPAVLSDTRPGAGVAGFQVRIYSSCYPATGSQTHGGSTTYRSSFGSFIRHVRDFRSQCAVYITLAVMGSIATSPSEVAEAKALLSAAWQSSSHARFEQLVAWATELLQPLAAQEVPEALWLLACLPGSERLTAEEFERRHTEQLRRATAAGSPSAKFQLGCQLDAEPTIEESTSLFREAAEQGHTYSKWCYGLNLLAGRGAAKNVPMGLRWIEEAASEKFEGAIQFLSKAYAEGSYGYQKDEGVAASWWSKLKDKDVVRF